MNTGQTDKIRHKAESEMFATDRQSHGLLVPFSPVASPRPNVFILPSPSLSLLAIIFNIFVVFCRNAQAGSQE